MHTTATLVQANLLFHLDSSPRLHESEILSVVSNSLRPHGILQARILEWVAFPFSRGSSQPKDQTWVSCIEDRFFAVLAIWEAENR